MRKILYPIIALGIVAISSCTSLKTDDRFDVSSVRSIIQANGQKWDQALKEQDIQLIKDLYDVNAHYLVDGNETFRGVEAITDFWQASFGSFKGLKLNMETLEGTRDLLYETGNGSANFDYGNGKTSAFKFKYVNVWKRQPDGTYRVVIDMFNDVKKP